MARKTKEDAEKTFQALLHAAADLFLEKGVTGTTLQEISQRAGMTRGALYWHFNSKDEIIRGIVSNFTLPHLKRLEQALEVLPDRETATAFRDILHTFLNTIVNDKQAGQAIAIIFRVVEITGEETELQLFLKGIRDDVIGSISKATVFLHANNALKTGLEPTLVAKSISCYFEGLIHQYYTPHPFVDLHTEGTALLDLYLDGILEN